MILIQTLKNWFQTQARYQVLSLLLAVIAWFLVHSGRTVEHREEFEVQPVNLDPELVFLEEPVEMVEFTLRGPFQRVRSLGYDEYHYRLDLSAAEAGQHQHTVNPFELDLPYDVRASDPQPRQLEFSIDEAVEKEIEFEVEFQGEAPEGMKIASVEVVPKVAGVRGPRSILERVESKSLYVPLEGQSESFSKEISVEWSSRQIQSIKVVNVHVELETELVERRVSDVPVRIRGSEATVTVEPNHAEVVVEAPSTGLADRIEGLEVYVDAGGLEPGRYRLRGSLDEDLNFENYSIEPQSFIVNVMEASE